MGVPCLLKLSLQHPAVSPAHPLCDKGLHLDRDKVHPAQIQVPAEQLLHGKVVLRGNGVDYTHQGPPFSAAGPLLVKRLHSVQDLVIAPLASLCVIDLTGSVQGYSNQVHSQLHEHGGLAGNQGSVRHRFHGTAVPLCRFQDLVQPGVKERLPAEKGVEGLLFAAVLEQRLYHLQGQGGRGALSFTMLVSGLPPLVAHPATEVAGLGKLEDDHRRHIKRRSRKKPPGQVRKEGLQPELFCRVPEKSPFRPERADAGEGGHSVSPLFGPRLIMFRFLSARNGLARCLACPSDQTQPHEPSHASR